MEQIKEINGALFAQMLKGGAGCLHKNHQLVNDLNVFPIPDGDTGDNMFMTIQAGVCETENEHLGEIAAKASKGMLLGARGNSGVILSRMFAGLSKGLSEADSATVPVLSLAMEKAVGEAYNAVPHPVEGTILTVLKDAVLFAKERINEDTTMQDYFSDLLTEMKAALERTPSLLAVLKEAGVVDSGGAGLVYIFEGMKKVLDGEESESFDAAPNQKKINIDAFTEDSVLSFGYCTEFMLRLQRAKVAEEPFQLQGMIDFLNSVGNSVVAFQEDSVVKVHVHTMTPGRVLDYGQRFGEFLTLKIENMNLQHNENEAVKPNLPRKAHKKYGLVAVATGKGIRNTFSELGVDEVIDGGQSMNPSTEDFIEAFKAINADTIFVFPNNGNVIMAASQAAELYVASQVIVVPSHTIGAGYAAISMMDLSSDNADRILEDCEDVMASVVTGEVSVTSRDATMDGFSIKTGDYIGFAEGKILTDERTRPEALLALARELSMETYDVAMIVWGESVTEAEANQMQETLNAEFPKVETILIRGEQSVIDYYLILE